MTEISSVKSGEQVITLKPVTANAPVGAVGNDNAKITNHTGSGESGPAPTSIKSIGLEEGQDPLEKAAKAIEEFITETKNTKLRIDKDDESGRFVYKSVDQDSGEVVGQFPPESILQMISKFRDPEGLVFDDEA